MRLKIEVVGIVFACLTPALAFGQNRVEGTVVFGSDNDRVVGVTVHLVNKRIKVVENGVAKIYDKSMPTTDLGGYRFDGVPDGNGYAVDIYDQTGKLVGCDTSFDVKNPSKRTAVPNIDISHGITADREAKCGGLIQTDHSIAPGANISNTELRELPLYNRNFLALGLIQPEVFDVEPGSPLQGAAFSIAGSPTSSTNFLLDGVDNVASSTNQAIPFQVNEAVREFRVVYSTPSLRYGQGSGGVVDVVTSSGENGRLGLHGSAFEYFNSDSLNAGAPLSVYSNSGFAKAAAYAAGSSNIVASPFNIVSDTKTPTCAANAGVFCGYAPQSYNELVSLFTTSTVPSNGCTTQLCADGTFNPTSVSGQNSRFQPVTSNQFGFSAGGKLGSNLYLFASYEGTRINNPNTIFERVPTTTDLPTLGSLTASDAAIAKGILGLFPKPNIGQTGAGLTSGTNTGIFGFYQGTAPNYTHVNTVQFRPDISLGHLGTLTFRYTGQLLDQMHDDSLPAGGAYPGNGAERKAQNQTGAMTHDFPFGKEHEHRNVLTIGFTQYRVDEEAQDRGFKFNSIVSSGLPAGAAAMPTIVLSGINPQTSALAAGTQGAIGGWYDSFWQTCSFAPSKCLFGGSGNPARSPSPITPSLDGDFPLARLGAPLSAPSKHRDTEAFTSDVLELKLAHGHLFDLGGDFRYQQNYSYDGGLARGLIVSNNIGEFGNDAETCVSCTPVSAFTHPSFDYELHQPSGYYGDLRSVNVGAFFEDTVKFKQATLVYGLRYEYFQQPLDTDNRLWNYNVANQGLTRQGSAVTFDAFDYQCGTTTATYFDAVYGSLRSSTPNGKWACGNSSFQLPTDKRNLTGRLGLSVSPDGNYKHVLRASVGGYYDHLPAAYNQKLLLNRPSPYNVSNPSSIYGQNFQSSYSSATCQATTQCGFGLSASLNPGSGSSVFQNYQAASGANILYERDPAALKSPYSLQFNLTYQVAFSTSWVGEFGYVGAVGGRLPVVYDGNYNNEFYCTQDAFCSNDTYFPVFTESNVGNSNFNSIVMRVEGRQWHGLSMHASYTFSKSLDNVVGSTFPGSTDALWTQLFGRQLYGVGNPAVFALDTNSAGYGAGTGANNRGNELNATLNPTTAPAFIAGLLKSANIPSFNAVQSALTTTGNRVANVSTYSLPQNPTAYSSKGIATGVDYGPSDFNVTSRGVADFVWNLPKSRIWGISNFTVAGIATVQTGLPFTIFSGPAYGQLTQLAQISSTTAIKKTGNPGGYLTAASGNPLSQNLPALTNANCPNLYAQPYLYQGSATGPCTGNIGRNSFTGPAYFSQDFSLEKKIPFSETLNVILRAEMFNAFNRANYYNPISELSTDGVHVNPEFGLIRSAHDPFQAQFSARLNF